MKGFVWNLKSIEDFKETVRQEYHTYTFYDPGDETEFRTKKDFLSDHEIEQTANAYKNNRTRITKDEVSYFINEYGARGDWSIAEPKPDHIKIAVFGCSFTFGVGIGEDSTWSALVQQRLKTSKPIQLINLGYSGGSISKSLKLFKYLTDVYKIDIAIFLLPTHWRDELPVYHTEISPREHPLVRFSNLIPNFNTTYLKDKWEEYYKYSTDGTRLYTAIKEISHIKLIGESKKVETYFSSWDETLFNFVKDIELVEEKQILPYFKFIENMLGPHIADQFARDGAHPGPLSQEVFARDIVEHLGSVSKVEGITRVKKTPKFI